MVTSQGPVQADFTCCIPAYQASKTVTNEGDTLHFRVLRKGMLDFINQCISASVYAPVGLPVM